jgi:hypothetical protein
MVKGKQRALHGVDVIENVGGIDSKFFDLITSNIEGSSSDVECMAIGNLTSNNVATIIKVMQLVIIKTQATLWKPHHCSFVC